MIIETAHGTNDSQQERRNKKYQELAQVLTPENPIRSQQYLRGRESTLNDLVRELTYFKSTAFVYGQRGVGKTSLASTASLICSDIDSGNIYAACSPGCRLNTVLRNICVDLIELAIRLGKSNPMLLTSANIELSLNPSLNLSFEKQCPMIDEFQSVDEAFKMIRDLDKLIPNSNKVIVILDELEELNESDRGELAFIVKQIGDQEIGIRFILVGIAENVHELIGAHQSIPRYIKEVSLEPLDAQVLLDIVKAAAMATSITIHKDYLYRIAIVGNGFPHFAHLMGKHILMEAVESDSNQVTNQIYAAGVKAAVAGSIEELKISYEQATQRPEKHNKHLLWALAHDDLIDVSTDRWRANYNALCTEHGWESASESQVTNALSNFKKATYGKIVLNTPTRYGTPTSRRGFRRFRDPLMRGHVRLHAEDEKVELGQKYSGKAL